MNPAFASDIFQSTKHSKRTMKHTALQNTLIAGLASWVLGTPVLAASPHQAFCHSRVLQGTYAYSGSGVTKDGSAPGVVYVQAGMESFDGKGHMAGYGSSKTSANDDSSNKRYEGSYTVNADCTGTLTYEEDGNLLEENIYVSPDGSALRYLSRTKGQFWAGEETRISRKLIVR